MRLTQMDTFLIRILYLFAAGIVCTTMLGQASIASALFSMTFILAALLWLSGATRKVTGSDAVLILIIGLALGHIMINVFLEHAAVSFGYFKKYIMFVTTLVYFQAASKLCIDDKTEKFLLRINSLVALFFIVIYAVNSPILYMIRGRVSNYLTFGFTNPNLTALFLMCIYTGELIQMFQYRSAFKKLWHLFLAAAMCWFVWETESRNCLMTIILETVLVIILYLTRYGFRLPGWLSVLVSVWPILFVAAYMYVMGNADIQGVFSFMVSQGKGLDARMSVWRPAMRYFWESPIIGAYSQISRGTGMSQMHNTHLDILVSYGTTILILVCSLLYGMIRSRNTRNLKEDTMVRICFCGTLIMGMGEAALFSGGLGIYLFAGMFLLLCNRERNQPVEEADR